MHGYWHTVYSILIFNADPYCKKEKLDFFKLACAKISISPMMTNRCYCLQILLNKTNNLYCEKKCTGKNN